jgi:hypothetical protein
MALNTMKAAERFTSGGVRDRLRRPAAGKADKEFHMAEDDLDEGPVALKRAVYDAGMKLEAEVDGGARGPAFSNAEDKAISCRAAGDTAGAAFWDETFRFLMTRRLRGGPERKPSSLSQAKPTTARKKR